MGWRCCLRGTGVVRSNAVVSCLEVDGYRTKTTSLAASVRLPAPSVMMQSASFARACEVTARISDHSECDAIPLCTPAMFASPSSCKSRSSLSVLRLRDPDAMMKTLEAL